MRSDGIYKVLEKLDIIPTREDPEWIMAHCPFAPYRHEKNAYDSGTNFGIHIEDGGISRYNCLSCKSKGTVAGLVFLLATLRDEPDLRPLARQIEHDEIIGGELDFGEWEAETPKGKKTAPYRVTKFPNERDFNEQYRSVIRVPEALRYLGRRRISVSTAFALGLRYDTKQCRIMFPVYDQFSGCFAGATGRSIRTEEWRNREEDRTGHSNPKIRDYHGLQKDRLLLGTLGNYRRMANGRSGWFLRVGSPHGPIIVVEGLFAYARLRQLRPRLDTVALLGSSLTYGKEQILRLVDRPIYWITDNDLAGDTCLYGRWDKELAKHNPEKKREDYGALDKLYGDVAQFTITWPEGKNDPDQLTGKEFDNVIETAELYMR